MRLWLRPREVSDADVRSCSSSCGENGSRWGSQVERNGRAESASAGSSSVPSRESGPAFCENRKAGASEVLRARVGLLWRALARPSAGLCLVREANCRRYGWRLSVSEAPCTPRRARSAWGYRRGICQGRSGKVRVVPRRAVGTTITAPSDFRSDVSTQPSVRSGIQESAVPPVGSRRTRVTRFKRRRLPS